MADSKKDDPLLQTDLPYRIIGEYKRTVGDILKLLDKDTPLKGTTNKRGMEIVMLYKNIEDIYTNMQVIISVTADVHEVLVKEYAMPYSELRNLFDIAHSVKKQFGVMKTLKNYCKNMPLSEKEHKALRWNMTKTEERFRYILDELVPMYVKQTPLAEREAFLKLKDRTLYDEFIETKDAANSSREDMDRKSRAYARFIVDSYPAGKWLEDLENAKGRALKRKTQAENASEEDKRESIRMKKDASKGQLAATVVRFKQMYESEYDHRFTSLRGKANKFHDETGKEPYIIMIRSIRSRNVSLDTFTFYNSNWKTGRTNSPQNAEIISLDENRQLPESVLNNMDLDSIVYSIVHI